MKIFGKPMLVFLAFGLLFLGPLAMILIPQAEATIIGQPNPPGLENKPSEVPPQHSQSGGFPEGFPEGFPPGLQNKPNGVPPQHSQSGGFP